MSFTLLALAGCQSMPKVAQETPNQAFLAETESGEAQERLNQINFKQLKKEQNRPIIALVLGSGGARGYAHIGAIQVLEQSGIRPDFIVGTSAGSIVGSLYASGKNANQIRDIALNMKASDVRDIRLDMKGFFDGQKVEDYVNDQVSDVPLQRLPIPMYVVATQLKEGKKVVFNYGNTGHPQPQQFDLMGTSRSLIGKIIGYVTFIISVLNAKFGNKTIIIIYSDLTIIQKNIYKEH